MSPGSSWIVLLIAKIVVSAGFVLGVTAAVERLGPRLGALIAATPQLSVVALIFFTLEQGPAFAAESAFWTIPGMCATIPVFLGYLVAVWLVPGPRIRSLVSSFQSVARPSCSRGRPVGRTARPPLQSRA